VVSWVSYQWLDLNKSCFKFFWVVGWVVATMILVSPTIWGILYDIFSTQFSFRDRFHQQFITYDKLQFCQCNQPWAFSFPNMFISVTSTFTSGTSTLTSGTCTFTSRPVFSPKKSYSSRFIPELLRLACDWPKNFAMLYKWKYEISVLHPLFKRYILLRRPNTLYYSVQVQKMCPHLKI
jgi:hypothetical protein